jgi:hypothetical protein
MVWAGKTLPFFTGHENGLFVFCAPVPHAQGQLNPDDNVQCTCYLPGMYQPELPCPSSPHCTLQLFLYSKHSKHTWNLVSVTAQQCSGSVFKLVLWIVPFIGLKWCDAVLAKVTSKHDFVLANLQLTDNSRFEPPRWLLYFHVVPRLIMHSPCIHSGTTVKNRDSL